MNIVLVAPEIPQNTGNIARTCVLTNSKLHLVKPLGFLIDNRYLKRAGLDYWDKLDLSIWDNFSMLVESNIDKKFYLATTKTKNIYTNIEYKQEDFIVFGSETSGLSSDILNMFPQNHIRIPMVAIGRSLNLSNSVNIVLYEALRQLGFPNLS